MHRSFVWGSLAVAIVILIAIITYFGGASTFLGARLSGPDRSIFEFTPIILHTRPDGLICYDEAWPSTSCAKSFGTTKVRTVAFLFDLQPRDLESTLIAWCQDKGLVTGSTSCASPGALVRGYVAKSDDFEASVALGYCVTNHQFVIGSEPCPGGASPQELGYATMAAPPLLTHEAYLCDALKLNNPTLHSLIKLCTANPAPTFPSLFVQSPTPTPTPTPTELPEGEAPVEIEEPTSSPEEPTTLQPPEAEPSPTDTAVSTETPTEEPTTESTSEEEPIL
jgi:hypothetical protein